MASVAEWYQTRGRHKVWAKGQDFPMAAFADPISSRLPGDRLRLRVLE